MYVLFCNGVWVCDDVCCVSSAGKCGLFLGAMLTMYVYVIGFFYRPLYNPS